MPFLQAPAGARWILGGWWRSGWLWCCGRSCWWCSRRMTKRRGPAGSGRGRRGPVREGYKVVALILKPSLGLFGLVGFQADFENVRWHVFFSSHRLVSTPRFKAPSLPSFTHCWIENNCIQIFPKRLWNANFEWWMSSAILFLPKNTYMSSALTAKQEMSKHVNVLVDKNTRNNCVLTKNHY